jgi:hypothetical protein
VRFQRHLDRSRYEQQQRRIYFRRGVYVSTLALRRADAPDYLAYRQEALRYGRLYVGVAMKDGKITERFLVP